MAHLDHGLRAEAADEAAFVAHLSTELGWRVESRAVDVAALAAERGWSLEEAGRRARYGLFALVAAEVSAGTVAVGHQAEDQVETILMNIIRGTGPAGLFLQVQSWRN